MLMKPEKTQMVKLAGGYSSGSDLAHSVWQLFAVNLLYSYILFVYALFEALIYLAIAQTRTLVSLLTKTSLLRNQR